MNDRSNLSAAMSVIARRADQANLAHEDLRAYHAPSECWDVAFDGWEEDTDRELEALGWNRTDLLASLRERMGARTADRWLHVRGLEI